MHNLPKKAKIIFIIVLALLLVLTVLFFIARAYSMPLSLMLSGFNPTAERVIATSRTTDNNEASFTVLQTRTKSGDYALISLAKNELGFWKVKRFRTLSDNNTDVYVSDSWMRPASYQFYDDGRGLVSNYESNYVIMGNTAVKRIAISTHDLPEGFTVNIWQKGEFYIVHAIGIGNSNFSLGLYSMLLNKGYISPQ